MNGEAFFVFAVIFTAGALMATNKVRFDMVALMVVLALILSGVLTVNEALSGFGSPVVAMVAGLLVLGEMLSRTGVARIMGDWVLKQGGTSEVRLLVLVMGGAALLGSVMSSTAVVALFIPVVLRIAKETRLNPSRMLIPLSYAALISGMLTLIATPPNIVVHQQLKSAGYEGFGFFSFSLVGLAVLAVSIVYILVVGRRLLGNQSSGNRGDDGSASVEEIWLKHSPGSTYRKVRVDPGSELAGTALSESLIESEYRVRFVGILKRKRGRGDRIVSPSVNTELAEGAILIAIGKPLDLDRLVKDKSLTVVPPDENDQKRWSWDVSGASILIHPDSAMLGKSLRECEFRSTQGLHVLGMRRNFKAVDDFENASLNQADSLFVVGPWAKIQHLSQKTNDFVVTQIPREHGEIVPSYERMGISLMILASMVLLTLFNVVPLVAAVMLASLAAVITRCLTMEDAYRAIHWSSLVLIAGMLPLASALDKTGGARLVVDGLFSIAGNAGPYTLMTLIFFLTASIGLVLPNLASAVLVSPIAIYAATALGASPYPFAVAVVIAASSSFSTPVATPVVSLVVEPGRYQFIDFVKTGLPLLLLTYAVTLAVTPWIFPFFP